MNVAAITRRELGTFLLSPVVYIVGALFLFVAGLFFYFTVAVDAQTNLTQVFNVIAVMLLFLTPVLTMRLLAEETQSGTIELLLTLPVRDAEIVMGKFLAVFLLFLLLLAPTFLYTLMLMLFGSPYLPVIMVGYLGLILLAAMLLSIGLMVSAMAANQLIAATATLVTAVVVWALGGFALPYADTTGTGFRYWAIQEHLPDFFAGLVSVSNVIYFVSITIAALFLATRALELRRWR